MASLHPSELDADSVASSPGSDHRDLHLPRVRFMCSFGGKILPRPHDNQLRYVGGDTRIVAVPRSTTFSALLTKLSKLAGGGNISVKYQLPNEDLDALISVTTDEDVENMMEEYDRIAQNQKPRSARLRLFLFTKGDDSRASSISSLLDGASNREHWFFDVLNSGAALGSGLQRGPSEASSIFSEVPDCLFGLDNSDEAQPRESRLKSRSLLHDNVSVSDPGSPGPVVSSQFCSASSAPVVPSIPDLPPVKTKLDNPPPAMEIKHSAVDGYIESVEGQTVQQQTGDSGQPMWHNVPDIRYSAPAPAPAPASAPGPAPPVQQIPFYYVAGTAQPASAPVQPIPFPAQYVQQYQFRGGQIPIGYHKPVQSSGQVYGGAIRPVMTMDHPYEPAMRMIPAEGVNVNQQVYYGAGNTGMVRGYPGMMVPGGEELARHGSDAKSQFS